MASRLLTLFATCLAGGLAGCSDWERPVAEQDRPAPQAPERRGLESLLRVRLRVAAPRAGEVLDTAGQEETAEALQARAQKQLAQELPHLDTAGSTEDWALEIAVAWQYENLPHGASKVPDRWATCVIRVTRPAVVQGRHATAVAYEGPQWTPEFPGWLASWQRPMPGSLVEAMDRAIRRFAGEWYQANPQFTRR